MAAFRGHESLRFVEVSRRVLILGGTPLLIAGGGLAWSDDGAASLAALEQGI
jgi:hypothetical protein